MEKRKNCWVIPTDKPSNYVTNYMESNMEWQNIYITSDEFIEERDFALNLSTKNIVQYDGVKGLDSYYKKIVLTTDPKLIADGVQAIDDEFLEWFIKNPSCEKVEIKMENYYASGALQHNLWRPKIIIPQKEQKQHLIDIMRGDEELGLYEEPKQETRKNRLLEELVEDIKNQQSFLKSIRKNPQLYYYKLGTCIYERLYNNNNSFEMQDPYGGHSSKMEQELIYLKAEKIYYE